MSPKYFLALALFISSSCVVEDKEQAIFDYLNMSEPERAISVLSLSECESYVDACGKLGVGLLRYEQHIDLGKQYLTKAAAAGHPRGKVVLGNFLIEGAFFEKDAQAGIRLLEEAVELGASEGMYYLANEYNKGENIEKDDAKALDLLLRASELGHIYAPYNAAVIHWELHQDCETAERYFEMSADVMDSAKKALAEIRTVGPCVDVLAVE